ncbi:phage major capsid protein [Gordonia sp. p3-SID1431]|uniref:phage major capsid protein n=1 Tax=Gordonia sp. p3-SID1431 TaxID=2916159 RepID=UPI0021A6F9A7|nr:phage major capsid protein [Gordonia sp. p3-SID1431]MCT1352234.1 phage major capsid protein [Gordonia sp. p3-SID1431]
MASTTSTHGPILSPEQISTLIIKPLVANSVAGQALTEISTGSHDYRFPIVAADPSASWVAEGGEIPVTDSDVDEVIVTPRKLAGLSVITSELANDSNPAAQKTVGDGLVRDLTRKLDQALFASSPITNGPAVTLGQLSGISTISAGSAFGSVDPFSDAQFAAADAHATIDTWVTSPTTAAALAKVKKATGSNEPLLGNDVTVAGRRAILGAPLLASPYAPNGVVWGIPRAFAYLVIREGSTVETDKSVFFTSDRIALRAKVRAAFGFPHPAAIVKISTTP